MRRSRMTGVTLVELMVAMVLGLVVIGGAVSLTMANRQSYRTSEGLSQVQESARTAFELLARDIRQAGVSGCDNQRPVLNVLEPAGGGWWGDWFGVVGIEGDDDDSAVPFGTTTGGDRVADTDALQLQGIEGVPFSVQSHSAGAASMVATTATNIVAGDVMFVCDFDHSAIFQVSAYDDATNTLQHAEAVGTPGNCTDELGFPGGCGAPAPYTFPRNSLLGHFMATDWYVGQTLRADEGGRALFRQRLGAGGVPVVEEIVSGVVDMQLRYRRESGTGFEDASALTTAAQWQDVIAVQVTLTVESADSRISSDAAVDEGRLRRVLTQVITLRNRVP